MADNVIWKTFRGEGLFRIEVYGLLEMRPVLETVGRSVKVLSSL